jgi:type II secretory pathway component PulM
MAVLLANDPVIALTASVSGVTSHPAQGLLDRAAAQDARMQQLKSKVQKLSAASPTASSAPEAGRVSQLVAPALPSAGINS